MLSCKTDLAPSPDIVQPFCRFYDVIITKSLFLITVTVNLKN